MQHNLFYVTGDTPQERPNFEHVTLVMSDTQVLRLIELMASALLHEQAQRPERRRSRFALTLYGGFQPFAPEALPEHLIRRIE